MRRTISILAFLVIIAFATSLIGCVRNNGGTTGEDVDFGGDKITIVSFWNDVAQDPGATEMSRRWYNRYKSLEEKYNCVFEGVVMVESEIAQQFEAAAMAGDTLGDVIFFRAEKAKMYQLQDMLLDVSKIMDLKDDAFNQSVNDMFTGEDGGIYAFSNYKNSSRCLLVFNKEMFDRFGIEYPYRYVKENTWTPEKFLEIAKAATRDDVYGFFGIVADPYLSYFIEGFGGRLVYEENGKYRSGLLDPRTIEGLEFIHRMNVIEKCAYVPDPGFAWTAPATMFMSGKVAMFIAGDFVLKDTLTKECPHDYGVVPLPKKPEIENYANQTDTHNVRVMHKSLDPERARKLGVVYFEYCQPLASPEEEDELEINDLEAICRDDESVQIIRDLRKIPAYFLPQIMAAPNTFYDVIYNELDSALRGDKQLLAALNENNGVFEEDLKRTNEGTNTIPLDDNDEDSEE